MKKLFFLSICCFVLLIPVVSNAGVIFGYGGAYGTPREVNKVLYGYNLRNQSILTKQMPMFHWTHGLTLGLTKRFGDNAGMEFKWTNRHGTISAQGNDPVYGTVVREMKFRSNCLSFGIYGGNKQNTFGMSFDLGTTFKGWTRRYDSDSADNKPEWTKVFQVEKNPLQILTWMIPTAVTTFYQRNLGPVGVRFFWQWQYFRNNLGILDKTLLGTYMRDEGLLGLPLHDSYSNVGIEINFLIGKR